MVLTVNFCYTTFIIITFTTKTNNVDNSYHLLSIHYAPGTLLTQLVNSRVRIWAQVSGSKFHSFNHQALGFPGDADGKESACQCRRHSRCRLGRSFGEGDGNPPQYPCLEKPMHRGACWATVHWVAESWTQLSTETTRPLGSTTSRSRAEQEQVSGNWDKSQ